ncbi:hypothetical protein GMDG_07124 [Pseudogymnoascus destructans 20631-21]|uniref:Uncharacterized protein n=2 Tax=Pseudogymnoascus destructans TaxID=655981 RepID=L8FW47_PSED2|nr:hypothetical protein GMDG_07124 [Pseudogymnoascus destructans 20631-21]
MIRNRTFLRTLLKYLLLPFYIIWHFFVFPRTRAKWYFCYRYCVKVIYRHRGRRSSSTARLVQDNPPYENNTIFRDTYSDRLSRLLILDISTLIASNLHYTDIQSLSLASSHIRETLFPTGNIRHHTAHFRLNSCNLTGKTRCWHCQIQLCDGCGFERELRDTPTSLHLEDCKPRCTTCYKDTTSGQSSCKCRPYLTKQMVCVNCRKLPSEVLVTHRDARDRAKLERSLMQPVPCSHCGAGLETDGPRWWVCTRCERECANHIHPGWAPKSAV